MSSVGFFALVRSHLTPGGVMAVNLNMASDSAGSINAALCDTIASVFDQVLTVDVPNNSNRVLFAAVGTDPADALEAGLASVEDAELANMMGKVGSNLSVYRQGKELLTDDKAPVEVLGMRVLDDYIAGELAYYKGIFAKSGLKGLLDAM